MLGKESNKKRCSFLRTYILVAVIQQMPFGGFESTLRIKLELQKEWGEKV